MKHLSRVTVVKAATDNSSDADAILSRIFAFVLDVIDAKGKRASS